MKNHSLALLELPRSHLERTFYETCHHLCGRPYPETFDDGTSDPRKVVLWGLTNLLPEPEKLVPVLQQGSESQTHQVCWVMSSSEDEHLELVDQQSPVLYLVLREELRHHAGEIESRLVLILQSYLEILQLPLEVLNSLYVNFRVLLKWVPASSVRRPLRLEDQKTFFL